MLRGKNQKFRFICRFFYYWCNIVQYPGGLGSGLLTFWGGDARRKISMEALRGSNQSVAQVDFKP